MKKLQLLKFTIINLAISTAMFAAGGAETFNFSSTPPTEFSDLDNKVKVVVKVITWLAYIVGGVLIGLAGFKLKEGDLKGFTKTLIGGACVFISPFLIKGLLLLSGNGA